MSLLGAADKLDVVEVTKTVLSCQNKDGGWWMVRFNGERWIRWIHWTRLSYSLHSQRHSNSRNLRCFRLCKHRIDCEMLVSLLSEFIKCQDIVSLMQPDGSFCGDKWGEVDTRFSYCAISSLSLLNRLDAICAVEVVNFLLRCMNEDGGFGSVPGAESHAGQSSVAATLKL